MKKIEIKNVWLNYKIGEKEVPILKGINLSIEAGDFIGILGPSGSGKSTFLYILGCLLKVNSGEIFIDNEDITRQSSDQLASLRNRKIGFIFQQFHLLPNANVLDNILLPSFYSSDSDDSEFKKASITKKAEQLAQSLGLENHIYHNPNQLSGGQQQRVAIARALLNEPDIILADEPTGNLDSISSIQIMEIIKKQNESGKTVVLITHDKNIVSFCSKIYHMKDGVLEGETEVSTPCNNIPFKATRLERAETYSLKLFARLFPVVFKNLSRNWNRTILTMLGITIGVAAILSMTTLGSFTKHKMIDSYADMGVNTLVFYGYPNWRRRATDVSPVVFQNFDYEKDLLPIKRVFPQIKLISPMVSSWNVGTSFGGQTIHSDVRVFGVSEGALAITNRELLLGRFINSFHVTNKSPVCVIGFGIAKRFFNNMSPLGNVISINERESSYGCRVIGVLKTQTSNKEYLKPNLQIFVPYSFFQSASSNRWQAQINQVLLKAKPNSDLVKISSGLKKYFQQKYGASGEFNVSSDSVLIAQMEKFLTIFTVVLAAIAFLALIVGGVGITNMMLVSIAERYREIGIRKALGATNSSIRIQFLMESMMICVMAGIIGLIFGFIAYHATIYGISRLIQKLDFEWVFDPFAILLSFFSILVVGILSGLLPAIKAEKLQVVEALRSE